MIELSSLAGGGGTELGELVWLNNSQFAPLITFSEAKYLKSGYVLKNEAQNYPEAYQRYGYTQFDLDTLEVAANSSPGIGLAAAAYGSGLLVGVGAGGKIVTSTDGLNWTARVSGTTGNFRGVAYGAGKFLAVTDTNQILTSINGINWSVGVSPFPANSTLTTCHFGENRFIVCGATSGVVSTATAYDGTSWGSLGPGITGSASFTSVCTGSGVFLATSGANIYRSTDGLFWSSVLGNTNYAYSSIVFTGTRFVAFRGGQGDSGNYFETSDTGQTWVANRMAGNVQAAPNILKAVFRNGTVLAMGMNNYVVYSKDNLVTWDSYNASTAFSNPTYLAAVSTNDFVMFGGSGNPIVFKGDNDYVGLPTPTVDNESALYMRVL